MTDQERISVLLAKIDVRVRIINQLREANEKDRSEVARIEKGGKDEKES